MRRYDLSNLSVLVLDDNRYFLQIMGTILRGFGIRSIVQCIDAFEAFENMKHANVDIAFVDINMPGLDGFEFMSLVRTATDSPNKQLPIIIVSGHATRSSVERAMSSGAQDYLAKPITPAEVYRRLVNLVEKQSLQVAM